MPRFLLFDGEGMACSLAWRIHLEGNPVRFLSLDKGGREHLQNMVPLVRSLNEGLAWVGKDGYVICGDERDVTDLRQRGFRCYGGSFFTYKMEKSRTFQYELAKAAGVRVSNQHAVKNIDEAIRFIQENPDQWVLKQVGDAPKTWNTIGKHRDGSDTILQLRWMKGSEEFKKMKGQVPFVLQEMVDGVEFAQSAWWNGDDWLRDGNGIVFTEQNREHKKVLNGDLGMTCGEAGTVSHITTNTRLFEEMIEPLTPWLKKHCQGMALNIDANCILAEEDGEIHPYLCEWTPREGYPMQSLLLALLDMEAGKFFADLIDHRQGFPKGRSEWGVVTVMGTGNYPQETMTDDHLGSFKDQPIIIPQWERYISEDIHPLYIKYDLDEKVFRVADYYEMPLAFTGLDDDILKANQKCVENMEKIEIRAPNYRTDVGSKFVEKELPKLREWGYI